LANKIEVVSVTNKKRNELIIMSDAIEFFGYFFFFWLFIFSPKYRRAQMEKWRNGSVLERIGLLFETLVSILIGLVLPVGLLWMLVMKI
jgi:hypothetical protein